MNDIRNRNQHEGGRWSWTANGYEKGFPRVCQFSDIDAAVEFDGHALFIECKHHGKDTIGFPYPESGQMGIYRELIKRWPADFHITVLILYGLAEINDPHAVRFIGRERTEDKLMRLVPREVEERRRVLKRIIDEAMGLIVHEDRASCPCGACIQKRLDSWVLS